MTVDAVSPNKAIKRVDRYSDGTKMKNNADLIKKEKSQMITIIL